MGNNSILREHQESLIWTVITEIKYIKMAGGLHQKLFGAIEIVVRLITSLKGKGRFHKRENLKVYIHSSFFSSPCPLLSQKETDMKVTIKRTKSLIEASRPNPCRPFLCNYWIRRWKLGISIKPLTHYLKTEEMICVRSMYSYHRKTVSWRILWRQRVEFGPMFYVCVNHLEET